MFRFVLLIVFTMMPQQYHSLGLDFSSLIGSKNHTAGKGLHELCEYFCDEGDYSDELFGDLLDEGRPRILCWICQKKVHTTMKPTPTTTTPTTSPTTATTGKTTASTTTTSTAQPTTTTTEPPTTTTTEPPTTTTTEPTTRTTTTATTSTTRAPN